MKQKDKLISVVVPTLGNDSLVNVIDALNNGSLVPDEILICIPTQKVSKIPNLIFDNVRILPTDCHGQVMQRICGFRESKSKYVLQLDDDIILDKNCLNYLIEQMIDTDENVAIAPIILNSLTNKSAFDRSYQNKAVKWLYYWLINGNKGYRPGTIYKSCSGDGVDLAKKESNVYELEWLAGGCVLHKKNNLILENYYPFTGKAYCEDYIHSYLLRKKNIKLFLDTRAVCATEVESYTTQKISSFIDNIYHDYIARKYFMKISSRKSIRIYYFYMFMILNYIKNHNNK